MDIMGYKTYWGESDGEIPESRINVASHIWDMAKGEHFFDNCKHKNVICRKVKRLDDSVDDDVKESIFAVKPVGDVLGHMMVKDNTLTNFTEVDDNIPIMPNYVRDLAGRVVCIAECYPTQKESSRTKRFPEAAFIVNDDIDPNNLIENVFFSNFRTLDMSPESFEYAQGGEVVDHYSYASANLYPYKLRVDSFYQDGWRLPQTEMLYVKKNKDGGVTESALGRFLAKWQVSENKNDYEAFYEECGGEEYFEELFNQGVTLVPTLEGYNANPVVDRDFNLVDFSSGKYVSEYHDIVEYVDSDQASGIIVKVIEPGFATFFQTKKAKVIVSNGSGYVSKNAMDPDPLYPDLRLPHARSSSKWSDLIIPTHPKHFEHASIWGWDFKTGMFIQEKGALWDPLHYYYESVDKIISNYERDVLDENYWHIAVPSEMKARFYPVIPFEGFDILDEDELEDRIEHRIRPTTMCKRYTENVFSANIGYHPMPPEYEFEIDSWFVPDLSPVKRVVLEVPLNVRNKLAEPIHCTVPAKLYLSRQTENSNNSKYWISEVNNLNDSSGDSKVDYPYLSRYYDHLTSMTKVKSLINLYVLIDDIDLGLLRTEYTSQIEMPGSIDLSIRDMALAYYDFKEKSFLRLKDRVKLYNNFYDEYVMSSWNSSACEDMAYMLKDESVNKLDDSQFSSVAIMQPPTF